MSEGALRPSDLLAQFKQTETRTRTQILAAELLDNTVELIREMVYTHTMTQPSPHGTNQQQDFQFKSFPLTHGVMFSTFSVLLRTEAAAFWMSCNCLIDCSCL